MRKIFLVPALLCCINNVWAQQSPIQRYLERGDYFRLRDELQLNANHIDSATRLYYGAIADNAFNKNEAAIQKATTFFRIADSRWTPQYILRMEEMLLDAYIKTYRYAEAAALSAIIRDKYPEDAKAGIINTGKIWTALANTPAQTVVARDNTEVQMQRNAIGLWEIPVSIGSKTEKFIFDTGANISTISESMAETLGLTRLRVSILVSGGQGKKIKSELGVAEKLSIGNHFFQNVVFLVMPDKELDFPKADFTINGIIGFPVINAMKEIRISKDNVLTIPRQTRHRTFGNLAMNGLTPLVRATSGNDTLVFHFDTGAAFTHLFSNYLEEHKDADNIRKAESIKVMSAGGAKNIKVYELLDFPLKIGDDKAMLHNVKIYTREVHTAGKGIAEGNMGQDVIEQFAGMTLNFENMYLDFE